MGFMCGIMRDLIGVENGVEMGKGMQSSGLIAGRNHLITGRNKVDRAGNCTGLNFCKGCGPQAPRYGPQ